MRLDRCKKCGYIVTVKQRYKLVEGGVEHIDCTDPEKGVAEKLAAGKPYLGPKTGYLGH